MIYDCFTFFDELDLLELRFEELGNIVDRFVLVEATKTFSNKPKELFFENNKERFSKFREKIVHIIVNDLPDKPKDSWENQYIQRNAIARGLQKCAADDIIIISDVDEVPREKVVRSFEGDFALLELDFFYYKINCKCTSFKWQIPSILRYKCLTTPQQIRDTWYTPARSDMPIIPNAGWHFSYLGEIDRIIRKIESISGQEYNTEQNKDRIRLKEKIEFGLDLFDRDNHTWEYVAVDNKYPEYILKNIEKFGSYIGGKLQEHK
jgi:beta-1,4-mannosyl-glycoprotein beta-1,4-N-acetylglucosaminyltransferase